MRTGGLGLGQGLAFGLAAAARCAGPLRCLGLDEPR